MHDIWIILYGTAAGFAFAGLLASLYEMAAGRQLGFALDGVEGGPAALGALLLRLVAGPYLLARGAIEQFRGGRLDPLWLAGLLGLACMWGFLAGIVVIDVLASLAPKAVVASGG